MSLSVRKPLRSKNELLIHNNKKKQQTKFKHKKPWDDSLQDRTQFKATPEEQAYKHQLHLPKKDHERLLRKIRDAQQFHDKENLDDFSTIDASTLAYEASGLINRKQALIKENFQHQELREVLRESNRTMNNVQDMFGDCVQKYKVAPRVTSAPPNDLSISYPSVYHPTREVLNETNINDLPNEDNSKFDKYAQLLHDHESSSWEVPCHLEEGGFPAEKTPVAEMGEEKQKQTEGNEKSGLKQTAQLSDPFQDMKKMLDVLEAEIDEYESESGRKSSKPVSKGTPSLKNYSTHLLLTVTRIVRHLKESETELRAEMSMRSEILQVLEEQKEIIDALTSDLMETGEQNARLCEEMETLKETCKRENESTKVGMRRLEDKLDHVICLMNKPSNKIASTDHAISTNHCSTNETAGNLSVGMKTQQTLESIGPSHEMLFSKLSFEKSNDEEVFNRVGGNSYNNNGVKSNIKETHDNIQNQQSQQQHEQQPMIFKKKYRQQELQRLYTEAIQKSNQLISGKSEVRMNFTSSNDVMSIKTSSNDVIYKSIPFDESIVRTEPFSFSSIPKVTSQEHLLLPVSSSDHVMSRVTSAQNEIDHNNFERYLKGSEPFEAAKGVPSQQGVSPKISPIPF